MDLEKDRIKAWLTEAVCPVCGITTTEETLKHDLMCEVVDEDALPEYQAEVTWHCSNCNSKWLEVFGLTKIVIDGTITTTKDLEEE